MRRRHIRHCINHRIPDRGSQCGKVLRGGFVYYCKNEIVFQENGSCKQDVAVTANSVDTIYIYKTS